MYYNSTKEDSMLDEHTYTIVDKNKNESSTNLNNLIENASLLQLKEYRESLRYFREMNRLIQDYEFYSEQTLNPSVLIDGNKTLKLEFKGIKNTR